MLRFKSLWRLWAKSLGEKEGTTDREADMIAMIRSVVVLVNFVTCFFIISWSDTGNGMDKWEEAFMETAETFAKLSHAKRLKVGAVIVKDKRIISIGYNGMP